ncbi:RBBP9/YdeN family alpha/beta hydrolase [Actinoplanes couchii]|nr:alpha/beta hydrolase [Actinoplanes couchii]MDR6323285.1 putative alpha/beta hydrolase family esterase [Actinoplanes couchii]
MSFLLLHGWQNRRPTGHWQHWLATELRAAGHEVVHPQLPDPDEPVLDVWLTELSTHVKAAAHSPAPQDRDSAHPVTPPDREPVSPTGPWDRKPDGSAVSLDPGSELTVIAHSLSCLLWLHAAARGRVPVRAGRVLLVAPPSPSITASHREIAGFAPPTVPTGQISTSTPFVTATQLAAAATKTHLVAADNDPYCPGGAATIYGEPLGIPTTVLPGQAHLDMDAGYGPWPAILNWSLTGAPLESR